MPQPDKLSVGFILTPKFTLAAFATFIDVLRLSSDEGDRSRKKLCGWDVLSENATPIESSCGIAISPTAALGDPTRFSYICVVGGLLDDLPRLRTAHAEFLQFAANRQVPLIGICTGAFVLHQLGLMRGRKCCVSWFHHNDFLEQFEGLKPVSSEIFVPDGDRLTCSGGVAAAHLAAFLVKRHIGTGAAEKALRIMQIDHAAEPHSPQPAAPSGFQPPDPLLQRLLLSMEQNLDDTTIIAEFAQSEGISRRDLERRFRHHLGLPPHQALQQLRLQRAQHLLLATAQAIGSIALECGFYDAAHFSRAFKRTHGVTPGQYRKREQAHR